MNYDYEGFNQMANGGFARETKSRANARSVASRTPQTTRTGRIARKLARFSINE